MELYNVTRQAIFYLGAYHGQYSDALMVIADASEGYAFFKGIDDLIKPELMARFGSETHVHLLPIKLI